MGEVNIRLAAGACEVSSPLLPPVVRPFLALALVELPDSRASAAAPAAALSLSSSRSSSVNTSGMAPVAISRRVRPPICFSLKVRNAKTCACMCAHEYYHTARSEQTNACMHACMESRRAVAARFKKRGNAMPTSHGHRWQRARGFIDWPTMIKLMFTK